MPTVLTQTSSNRITVFRNDSLVVRCTVNLMSTGTAAPLTGYTARMTVKRNQVDDDDDAIFQATGSTPDATGIITFAITKDNTLQQPGTYYYDIQLISGNDIKTVVKDEFVITWDVTRATS